MLGHLAAALAMLANHLAQCDAEIAVGTLVLLGSITEAIAVKPGNAVTFVLTPAMSQFSLRHLMVPGADRALGRADRLDQRLMPASKVWSSTLVAVRSGVTAVPYGNRLPMWV